MHIDAQTKVFGIIGYPLGHSFSPAMHNAAFAKTGYNGVYVAFPQKNLLQLKHALNLFNIQGLSVTIPHKRRVFRMVDHIDPLAVQIGSLNTLVKNPNGLWEGYNTDGMGAVQAIEESGFDIANKKILIVGNGGSARGIAFALARKQPALLSFLARKQMPSQKLKQGLKMLKAAPKIELLQLPNQKWSRIVKKEHIVDVPQKLEKFDLIIQTTPAGMKGHPLEKVSLLPKDFLFPHQVVFDIVYNLPITPLVDLSKRQKMKIIPGYKMLLWQGVLQFELFTNITAPVQAMEKALLKAMKQEGIV